MRVLLLALVLAQSVASASAHAECSALFNALERADQQPRVAHYGVERGEQPLTGQPLFVRVGQANYYGVGTHFERVDSDGNNSVVQALRNAAEDDALRCTLAGSDTYRGESVKKITLDDPTAAPDQQNVMTLWIDDSSDLPVFQQSAGASVSIAWIYGDVDEPTNTAEQVSDDSKSTETLPTAGDTAGLEHAFWVCDYAGTNGMTGLNQEALCTVISDELREVKFGGDFATLLAWWQQNKTAKHQEVEQEIADAIESERMTRAT